MSQAPRKLLAQNVKKYRESLGMTKEALSTTLEFDNSYISKLEKKKVNATIDRISLISNYFGVKFTDLFKE